MQEFRNSRTCLLHLLLLVCLFSIEPSRQSVIKSARDKTSSATQKVNLHPRNHGHPEECSKFLQMAKGDIQKQEQLTFKNRPNEKPKNIIFFLGDGMGVSTITLARLTKALNEGKLAGEDLLNIDRFDFSGSLRTFSADSAVTDSAASATAYLTGCKANNYCVGVDYHVKARDENSYHHKFDTPDSILIAAKKAGYLTGFATTCPITDASPAALYAHTYYRKFEFLNEPRLKVNRDGTTCLDIATQFVDASHMFDLVMGGGRQFFIPNDESPAGLRGDGRNLINEWVGRCEMRNEENFAVYQSAPELIKDRQNALNMNRVLAFFNDTYMPFDFEMPTDARQRFGMKEMTEFAIEFLEARSKTTGRGYVLFMEGGLIDIANHANLAKISANETVAFDEAIGSARNMTNKDDTLIIVTADHSHGLLLNTGSRDNSVNGIYGYTPANSLEENEDDIMNLIFGTGPGGNTPIPSSQNMSQFTENMYSVYPAKYYEEHALHSGEDVAIIADGPMSHFITGSHDNTYVAYLIKYLIGMDLNQVSAQLPENFQNDQLKRSLNPMQRLLDLIQQTHSDFADRERD